jgi:hypothetical protein
MSSIPDNVENNGFHSKLVQYGMDVVSLKTNVTVTVLMVRHTYSQ